MDTDFLTTPCGGPMRLTGSVTLHTLRWAKIMKIEIRHELTRKRIKPPRRQGSVTLHSIIENIQRWARIFGSDLI
jgi:hypothetical protein